MNDLDFLRELYALGARAHFDALAAHTYGFLAEPEAPPAQQTLNFRRVESLREIMLAQGDGANPSTSPRAAGTTIRAGSKQSVPRSAPPGLCAPCNTRTRAGTGWSRFASGRCAIQSICAAGRRLHAAHGRLPAQADLFRVASLRARLGYSRDAVVAAAAAKIGLRSRGVSLIRPQANAKSLRRWASQRDAPTADSELASKTGSIMQLKLEGRVAAKQPLKQRDSPAY